MRTSKVLCQQHIYWYRRPLYVTLYMYFLFSDKDLFLSHLFLLFPLRYQIRNRGSRCIEVVIDENQQATGGSAVSIDSCDSDASNQTTPRNSRPPSPSCFSSGPSSPSLLHRFFGRRSSSEDRSRAKERASSVTRVEVRRHSMGMEESSICRKESASLPNSPLHKAAIYQNSIKVSLCDLSPTQSSHLPE